MTGAALSLLLDVVRKNEQNDHKQSADQAAGTDTRTSRLHDEAERVEHNADDAQHPEHADLRRVIRTAHAPSATPPTCPGRRSARSTSSSPPACS